MKLIHKIYAYLFGYFWLPCPRCGQMFGGHQKGGGTNYDQPFNLKGANTGKVCCPDCVGDVYKESTPNLKPNLEE
jgi:hypothetical protein